MSNLNLFKGVKKFLLQEKSGSNMQTLQTGIGGLIGGPGGAAVGGMIGGVIGASAGKGLRPQEFLSEEIALTDLHRIITKRYENQIKAQTFYQLSYGQADYLPYRFLEKGLRSGAPVCRILRNYSNKTDALSSFIDWLKEVDYPKSQLTKILPKLEELNYWKSVRSMIEIIDHKDFRDSLKDKLEEIQWIPVGTGFLVSQDHILTNYHILASDLDSKQTNQEDIEELYCVEFLYERDYSNQSSKPVKYEVETVLHKNMELDYALIKLKELDTNLLRSSDSTYQLTYPHAGDNFGWLPMLDDEDVIAPTVIAPQPNEKSSDADTVYDLLDKNLKQVFERTTELSDPVFIIQHPMGQPKQIVLFNNQVDKIYKNHLKYSADADFGSSGSPVFNNQWQLIALHQGAFVKTNNGDVVLPPVGHLGVRICSIVQDLKAKINDLKKHDGKKENKIRQIENILGESLEASSHKRSRKVHVFMPNSDRKQEFDGIKETSLISEEIELLSNLLKYIDIENSKAPALQKLEFHVHRYGNDLTDKINWLNSKTDNKTDYEYRPGDIALEILTDMVDVNYSLPVSSGSRGVTAYYVGNKPERRAHAELFLQSLVAEIPELPNRGAKSDNTLSSEQLHEDRRAKSREAGGEGQGLTFCRDVSIPSLVLYLGFISNQKDLTLLRDEKSLKLIAKGLLNGLVNWSNMLSPTNHI